MEGSKGITPFFSSVPIQVVPRVLPYSAYIVLYVVGLIVTCRNGGPITK